MKSRYVEHLENEIVRLRDENRRLTDLLLHSRGIEVPGVTAEPVKTKQQKPLWLRMRDKEARRTREWMESLNAAEPQG
jgi:hypothetical protein